MRGGGPGVDPRPRVPGTVAPGQLGQVPDQPVSRGGAHRVDRVGEGTAQQVQRVAHAQHVIGRGPVLRQPGRTGDRRCRAVLGDQSGDGVLERAQPCHVLGGGQVGRRFPEEKICDLDGVAVRPHGRLGTGPVDVPAGAGLPAAVEQVGRLRAGGGGERGQFTGERRRLPVRVRYRPARLPSVAYPPGRVAGRHRPRGQVLRDDRAGADDAVVADGDTVHDDHVGADPHVVADRDPAAGDGLLMDRQLGRGPVVEGEQRAVGADTHPVPEGDRAAHHRERVDRAVGAGAYVTGDVGVSRDVRAVAQVQDVRVHRGRLRDEAALTEPHGPRPRPRSPEQPLPPLLLRRPLPLRCLLGVEPRTVVEDAVVVALRLFHVILHWVARADRG